MSPRDLDSDSASGGAATPSRKGKKRVGWQSFSSTRGDGGDEDIAMAEMSPPASPRISMSHNSVHGAPDALELTRALTRVLTNEREERFRPRQEESSPPSASPEWPKPSQPRPVLKRDTSYDAWEERRRADSIEKKTPQQHVKSLNDAQSRANALALSVGSHSAPVTRRNSADGFDFPAAFQTSTIDSDDSKGGPEQPLPSKSASSAVGNDLRYRFPAAKTSTKPDPLDAFVAAKQIVDAYPSRTRHHLFQRRSPVATGSGASTPRNLDDSEYVSRPSHYRGGVLASLLKLSRDERGGPGNSGFNTPTTPSTPNLSPRSTPPASRSSSPTGKRGSSAFLNSGLFHHRRSNASTSSLTLAELMKSSSSMFTATASSEISDRVNEKIKKEHVAPKPNKKDKIRITVHIAGIIARHRYLIKLCRALMMYGAPTHRLEEYMAMSSRVLEIEGQFLYIPSCMLISFDDSTTHTTEVKLVRVPQGIDLGKLRDVHDIYKEVVHDKLGVEVATKRLEEVMDREGKFPTWFRVLMYGVASAFVGPFAFQGRFIDLPPIFLLGCLLGVMQLVFAPNNELYAHVFEVTASVIISFCARGFGSIRNGQLFCFSALAQSGIALILPGYIVLCSSLELQSHNIVAGSVRMVYAMIYSLFLGYGITIGATLYGMFDKNATSNTQCSEPLAKSWNLFFVPAFTLCLCIINQSKWSQTPVMLIMALAGFCVNSYSSEYFQGNTQVSNMLGALTVGILANLYSRMGPHAENLWLDFIEWWDKNVRCRLSKKAKNLHWPGSDSDPESRPGSPNPSASPSKPRRIVGHSLAAAAMLPAIFVQVPSGLAAGGSLLAGITSANQITGNSTTQAGAPSPNMGGASLDSTPFVVLFSVIQIAIGISVGLFMSALIVYPLGKRRSGLFSF